ncbi:hypothetical protein KFE98_16985 [bacterium SCSIO 12741]|nr:hypothetical protein KFE98_16985 [bacterium SCSIO 12741]
MELKHPCPMALSRLENKDGSFSCSACARNLVDFRGKSEAEIRACAGKDLCGVFDLDQLPDQKRYSGWNQMLFSALALLSLIGFSVKPLSAQTTEPIQVDSVQAKPEKNQEVTVISVSPAIDESSEEEALPVRHKRKRRLFRRKRIAGSMVGWI